MLQVCGIMSISAPVQNACSAIHQSPPSNQDSLPLHHNAENAQPRLTPPSHTHCISTPRSYCSPSPAPPDSHTSPAAPNLLPPNTIIPRVQHLVPPILPSPTLPLPTPKPPSHNRNPTNQHRAPDPSHHSADNTLTARRQITPTASPVLQRGRKCRGRESGRAGYDAVGGY